MLFPVRTGSPEDRQSLFANVSGERVTEQPLREHDQLGISNEQVCEEPLPAVRFRVCEILCWTQCRKQVFPAMLAEFTGPQIKRAVRNVQSPRVTVELLRHDGDAWFTLRKE